jgi:hypothetical protein
MRLPFTPAQFFDAFRQYNETVWPAQAILTAAAVLCVLLVVRPRPWAGPFISAVLAFFWAWLALAYHLSFFARINPLAYVFAAVSLTGAVLFFWFGVLRRSLRFSLHSRRAVAGLALIGYALAVYPMLSIFTGHRYPAMPTFGLPCPTTIFTAGILAMGMRPMPRAVWIAPILWSVVGFQGGFLLGVPQDFALGAVLPVGIWAMLDRTGERQARAAAGPR